jgi:hypothetical protein
MGAMSTQNLRERGRLLQRRVTLAVVAVSAVLAGVFAGIAAATGHGTKVSGSSTSGASQQQESDDSFEDSGSISPPAQVPSQTAQPPVASSGGS